MSDVEFLFLDFCLMTMLAIVMGRGGPSEQLHSCRPPASLLALPFLGSLFLHTCMVIVFQLAAVFVTTTQEWYVPLNHTMIGDKNLPNMENASVFYLSGFQYIILAVVVTKGYPHKKPLYHNVIFLFIVLVLLAVMSWLVVSPGVFICGLFQLFNFQYMDFKMLLLALAALNFFVCFAVEVVIDLGVLNYLRCNADRPSKKTYKRLDSLLCNSPSWPPLNQPLLPSNHTVVNIS